MITLVERLLVVVAVLFALGHCALQTDSNPSNEVDSSSEFGEDAVADLLKQAKKQINISRKTRSAEDTGTAGQEIAGSEPKIAESEKDHESNHADENGESSEGQKDSQEENSSENSKENSNESDSSENGDENGGEMGKGGGNKSGAKDEKESSSDSQPANDETSGNGNDDSSADDDQKITRRKRGAANFDPKKSPEKLWDSPIYWDMDSKLAKKSKDTISGAIKAIQQNTCLKFVKKSKADGNSMFFKLEGSICESLIGRSTSGKQNIKINEDKYQGCVSNMLISHEIFHALGLAHEIKRVDRDKKIKIIDKNIDPKMVGQFKKDRRLFKYTDVDIQSAMFYAQGFGARQPGEQTQNVNEEEQNIFLSPSYRAYLTPSFDDWLTINKMYKCVDPCNNEKCENGGYKRVLSNNAKKCVCNCPPGTRGKNCETIVDRCGKLFTSSSGEIEYDSGVTDPLSNNQKEVHCTWLVHAEEKQYVHVSFYDYVTIPERKSFLEIRNDGIALAGLRITGGRDPGSMAYIAPGPFLVDLSMTDNAYNIGFKAAYSVVNKKCPKVCYNGGILSKSCQCKCRPGFSGRQCKRNKNKDCMNKPGCENRGRRDPSQKGCPCICPPMADASTAKKHGMDRYPITGDQCQYFGECYMRLDEVSMINNMLGNVVDKSTLYKMSTSSRAEKSCAKLVGKKGFSCKGDIALKMKCPIACSTPCACTNAMDKVDLAGGKSPGKACRDQASHCGTAPIPLFCAKQCKSCTV